VAEARLTRARKRREAWLGHPGVPDGDAGAAGRDRHAGRTGARASRRSTRARALVLGHGRPAASGPGSRRCGGGPFGEDRVVLVEQPYRVAGRRAPARAPQLDAAWISVVEHLRAGELEGLPVAGGARWAAASRAELQRRPAQSVRSARAFQLEPRSEPEGAPGPPRQGRRQSVPTLVVRASAIRSVCRGGPAGGSRVPGDHGRETDLDAVLWRCKPGSRGLLRRVSGPTGGQRVGGSLTPVARRPRIRRVEPATGGAVTSPSAGSSHGQAYSASTS
jgi:hypothetical protein